MKKSMLCAGLLAMIGTSDFATAATQINSTNPVNAPPAGNAVMVAKDATAQMLATADAAATPIHMAATENKSATTAPASTATAATTATTATTATVDCNYKIPATTTTVDQALVQKWSGNATVKAFDFDFKVIDDQLKSLKPCFTEQGWQSFNDALQKSGNLKAIKSEKLMVSSMIDGQITINPIKENQWKISLPLQVVYQNEKEKLNQPLTIDLVVGRKVSGDLGIMQMIAMPRLSATAAPAAGANPAATPATSNPGTAVTNPAQKPAH